MSISGAPPNGESIARSALLDALFALQSVSANAFIVVGAQAVYLRSKNVELPIAPLTFDGDIVADPRRVRHPRAIRDALEKAQFEIRSYSGSYHRPSAPESLRIATRIDVFVPERFQNDWDLQGWGNRDATAVMTQPGLELALADRSLIPVTGMEQDSRSLEVLVAGPAALLIAKGWKIGERYEKGPQEFANVAKDVVDVYRLLMAVDKEHLAASIANVPREPRYSESAKTGSGYLRSLLTGNGEGLNLLRSPQMFGRNPEAEVLIESLGSLVLEFCDLVDAVV